MEKQITPLEIVIKMEEIVSDIEREGQKNYTPNLGRALDNYEDIITKVIEQNGKEYADVINKIYGPRIANYFSKLDEVQSKNCA